MTAQRVLEELCSALALDAAIGPRLISVIWIGSSSHGRDMHSSSDVDLQIIMDRPEVGATAALSAVLSEYPSFDLSILYEKDVFDVDGGVDFQDGTKGAFFIPVLADGVILYGTDFYRTLRGKLTLAQAKPSLMFTIREYLGRLRVMATQGERRAFEFKKYSLKYLKDVLVYEGILRLHEMVHTSNATVIKLFRESYETTAELQEILATITDYSSAFTILQKATLLTVLEALYDSLESDPNDTA
jgi:hypothetical protein